MTLINLEDVLNSIEKMTKYTGLSESEKNEILRDITSLPTHDPIAILKEMIEEYKWNDWNWNASFILETAIDRITKHNNQWQNN